MTLGLTEPFPPYDLTNLAQKNSKVCVVSIIGKSRYSAFSSKASLLNPSIGKDVFKSLDESFINGIAEDEIEYYYDTSNHVVYLHYSSLLDSYRLATLCQKLDTDVAQQDFHTIWETEEFHHAKTWLLLFCVSHIVLLVHPGSSFDTSFIRIFRILDTLRVQLLSVMSEQLQGLHISKEWYLSARPCSPRVLFVFQTTLLDISTEDNDMKPRSQRNPPLKRLQHAMEDQIYRLLRKSRVITNISNNSLFAVPANQEFVFINSRRSDSSDPVAYFLLQLRNTHTVNKDGEPMKGKSYQTSRRTNQGSPGRTDNLSHTTSLNKCSSSDNSFHDFLWPHIELAFNKGFDDNVGKRQVPALFEMATASTWFTLASKLYQLYFNELSDTKAQSFFNKMRTKLDVDIRFSENRCNKVLPVAETAYQEGLPTHYTNSYHLSKFNQAKRVFAQYARGAAYKKYLCQLEEACEKWWKSGRQLCEEISLTGQHCVNPLHRLPDAIETEENKHLPVMYHSSQLKTKAACNCGRKQADKEDPFNHEAANFEFYDSMEKSCCCSLQHVDLPVFKPGTDSFQPSPLVKPSNVNLREGSKSDITHGIGNLSLALSLGQSGSSDLFASTNMNTESLAEASNSHPQEIRLTQPEVERVFDRQHSTTEYLPDMINSDSPSGLLPKFSSWSLCALGKTSSYVHSQGLDLPGFFHGSNFLLPWDISLRMEKDKWPGLGEANKKTKQKRIQKESGEVNVRVYIGVEYECPRGHRFFSSGPDKLVKMSSSSNVKDNAHKLLTSDMPLFCSCPCRTKGHMAQLMRVYAAPPECPITVTLNPVVQPAHPHHGPNFYPGNDDPIKLSPGNIWVLRLPHIYVGNGHVHSKPNDFNQQNLGCLNKGIFGYQHIMDT
ncbi:protein SMG8 [Octopus sinensis]|nr:protein SMG8 [Octopus sinensis]